MPGVEYTCFFQDALLKLTGIFKTISPVIINMGSIVNPLFCRQPVSLSDTFMRIGYTQ